MKLLKVLLTASAAIGISISSFAAINININSGNPVMPFPQFMDYVGGETLVSHLPTAFPTRKCKCDARRGRGIQ